jgi:hypothetical protein
MKTIISLILLILSVLPCYGLGYKYLDRYLKNIHRHVTLKTPYIWGDTDCSGTLAEAAFDAGIPVIRTTSYNMSKGIDGWKSRIISREEAIPGTLIFWDITDKKTGKTRIKGHVGTKTTKDLFAHASFGRGHFLEDPWGSPFGLQIDLYRELTFGNDEKE